jgi:hypothetical protein
MFFLNFLPSVGEKRQVILNLEASDNHFLRILLCNTSVAQKVFGENRQFSIIFYEFNVKPLTYTVSRSIDGPDVTS